MDMSKDYWQVLHAISSGYQNLGRLFSIAASKAPTKKDQEHFESVSKSSFDMAQVYENRVLEEKDNPMWWETNSL